MNLENIQTFLRIVENGSFTRTAEELYCSQAAVSLRIKKLEENLDANLFVRNRKKFELTGEGKSFIPYARKIVETIDDARKELFISRNMGGIAINISSSSTPGTYLFPRIIHKFRLKYPDTEIINQVQYTKDVIKDVVSGKYAIGFVSQPPQFSQRELLCESIADDPLCLITSTDHPWSQKLSVDLEELKDQKILVSNPRSSIISFIESIGGFRLPADQVHVVGNIEAIKRSVIDNQGVALISRMSVRSELKFKMLSEIPISGVDQMNREIFVIIGKSTDLTMADNIFLDFVKENIEGIS